MTEHTIEADVIESEVVEETITEDVLFCDACSGTFEDRDHGATYVCVETEDVFDVCPDCVARGTGPILRDLNLGPDPNGRQKQKRYGEFPAGFNAGWGVTWLVLLGAVVSAVVVGPLALVPLVMGVVGATLFCVCSESSRARKLEKTRQNADVTVRISE